MAMACAVFMLFPLMPSLPAQARSAQEVQEEINEKKEHLDALESQINASETDKAAAETAMEEYKQNYENLLVLIGEQEKLITNTDAQLDAKSEELAKTVQSLQENREKFEERLVAIYKVNNANVLSSIFTVSSFTEFLQMVDALRRISQNDTSLLDDLVAEREAFTQHKADLENTIENLNTQMEELQGNRDWAAGKVSEMEYLASQATEEIQASQDETKKTEAEIAELEAERQKIFEKAAALASQKNDGSTRQTANGPVADNGAADQGGADAGDQTGGQADPPAVDYSGTLRWPVPAGTYVSSWFGDGRSNTGSHYGIDIPAGEGSAIVAAAPGTVVIAEFHYSYGNYIVIDHGDGMRTLYAHCVRLDVGVGAVVDTGQTIAGVGNTGDSYGAHLHFEVHDNGVRQNPVNYLNI